MIQYLQILPNDYHDKSRYRLSPHKAVKLCLRVLRTVKICSLGNFQTRDAVSLPVVAMPCLPLQDMQVIAGRLYLLTPFARVARPPPALPLWGPPLCSLPPSFVLFLGFRV